MDQERGERNAVELKRRFHGVKWIVVLDEHLGNQFGVV